MAREKEAKEKTEQRTFRLPVSDLEMIDLLAKRGMVGSTASAVVRALVRDGLKELVQTEYVKKHLETLKLLRERAEEAVDNSPPQTEALPKIPES